MDKRAELIREKFVFADEVDIAIDLIKKLDIKLMTQTEFMQQVDKIYMTITQEENYEDWIF